MDTRGLRLVVSDRKSISRLGELFRTAKFNEDTIQKALGGGSEAGVARSEIPLLLRRLPWSGLLPTLIRLFLIGEPVATDIVARDLAPLTPDRLASLGLVSVGALGIEPRVRLEPYADLVLVADMLPPDYTNLSADFVPGMNPSSVSVAALTIRRPVKTMLDLGTGFGVHALYCARHCEHVVATDINPRALNFAAFNAALNGIQNVEFREGNLFEPVADETFDLIVCNPPYVISPEAGPLFRDGRAEGDSLSRTIVQQIPRHLHEGGFASVRCSWALRDGEEWSNPVRTWVENSGCDALLLHASTETPFEYAADWNRPVLALHPGEFGPRVDRWLEYFKRLGIQKIATGGLILRRRREGRPWVRTEESTIHGGQESGVHFLRMFEAEDWLGSSPDFSRAVLLPANDLKVEQTVEFHDGAFGNHQIGLTFVRGLKLRAFVDVGTTNVIMALNGSRSLGEILDRVVPAGQPEAAEIRSKIEASIARLHALGFILRVPGP